MSNIEAEIVIACPNCGSIDGFRMDDLIVKDRTYQVYDCQCCGIWYYVEEFVVYKICTEMPHD